MAGKIVTAIRRQQAEARLLAAVASVAGRLNIDAAEIPLSGKDPDLLRAAQMEAMADVMEAIDQKLGEPAKKGKAS
jgi:hypothetical protein